MSDTEAGTFQLTKAVPMIHPALIEARPYKDRNGKEKGDPKFGASFLFSPDDPELAEMVKAMVVVARQEFGKPYAYDKNKRQLRATKKENGKTVWDDSEPVVALPLKDGDKMAAKRTQAREKAGKPEDEKAKVQHGKIILKGSSLYQPQLGVIDGKRILDLGDDAAKTQHKGKFYFGVEALASFRFKAVEMKDGDDAGRRYVTCYLQTVCSTNKGKKISGGQSLAERFSGYVGQASMENPLDDAPEDDEIPF